MIHRLILILLLFPNPGFARSINYDNCVVKKLGWHFYCDPKPVKKKRKIVAKKAIDPLRELKEIQQDLKLKRTLAILYPTEENIKNYIKLQRVQLDRASYFSDRWRRVIWSNPELDYTLLRPVSTLGKQAWSDQKNAAENQSLADIQKRYGIFFIYRSDCLYCHRYSPILKIFAQSYGLTIKAISQDGRIFKDWPDSLIDQGQIKDLGLDKEPVPATLLYDNKTKKVKPIGFGILSEQDLKNRMYLLTKVEVGDDY